MLDAAAIGIATLLAYLVREWLGQTDLVQELANEVPTALSVLPLWLLILYFTGAYRPEYINSVDDAFRRFTDGTVAGVLALGFLSFLLNLQLSRLFVGLLFSFVFVLGALSGSVFAGTSFTSSRRGTHPERPDRRGRRRGARVGRRPRRQHGYRLPDRRFPGRRPRQRWPPRHTSPWRR